MAKKNEEKNENFEDSKHEQWRRHNQMSDKTVLWGQNSNEFSSPVRKTSFGWMAFGVKIIGGNKWHFDNLSGDVLIAHFNLHPGADLGMWSGDVGHADVFAQRRGRASTGDDPDLTSRVVHNGIALCKTKKRDG